MDDCELSKIFPVLVLGKQNVLNTFLQYISIQTSAYYDIITTVILFAKLFLPLCRASDFRVDRYKATDYIILIDTS